jgi:Nuclear transport factor 2 (NTF2) domain/RNA recognition motif. (a.k.a. RRM, RBD, or RNP domain)
MSNQNQPHHKFVQTFVLAEQPNGYFVLNDIFRYLNEDEDEIIEDEPAQPEVPAEVPTEVSAEVPAVIPAEVAAEEPPTPVEPTTVVASTDDTVASEEAADKVDEELEEVKEEEHATAEEAANTMDAAYEFEEPPATTETEPADETPEEEAPVEVTPQEDSTEAPATEPTPPKASTPVPDAPPAKKTWASMLGGASKSPVVPAIPSQAAAATTQPKAPRLVQPPQPAKSTSTEPTATTPTSQGNGWQMADHGKKGKSAPQAKAAEANVLAYIKNVNEKVDARTLREVLERYGELKYFDVSRPRVSIISNPKKATANFRENCAFVEFATPEGYAAAVAANPHTVNTESISVEERRPRPGAYGGGQGSFARGNGAPGRGGRGNMQQRTGSQGSLPKDAGRGFQQPQRGSKSGNVTPRGRGQAQAA